jgi:hypothetical protein
MAQTDAPGGRSGAEPQRAEGFARLPCQIESTTSIQSAVAKGWSQMTDSDPRFEARPSAQLGQNWCVHVIWPSGEKNVLSGFATQYQALEWIKKSSANWVVEQIMGGPA